MNNEIKPIETIYNGYKFRSRLEARWAVFFDAMGIEYEYEPEGIEVNGCKYLPDFYFPELELFGEVKGNRKGWADDILKMSDIYEEAHGTIPTVIFGNIPTPEPIEGIYWFPVMHYDTLEDLTLIRRVPLLESGCFHRNLFPSRTGERQTIYHCINSDYEHAIEPKANIEIDYSFIMYEWNEEGTKKVPATIDVYRFNEDEETTNLFLAYCMARQARFEHGETPRIKEE